MNKEKMIPLSLLLLSTFMLFMGFSYQSIEKRVQSYSYSDKEEYDNLNDSIKLIESLPIHINIMNQYFSSVSNLDEKLQEEIILAYAIKNRYKTYNCSDGYHKSICINKEDLNSHDLQRTFNTNITFTNETIDVNLDYYGKLKAKTDSYTSYYKIDLNNYIERYTKHSDFYKFKKDNDKYIVYVYEGYYESNCTPNTKIVLKDFLDPNKTIEGTCSQKRLFSSEYEMGDFQLYKYELSKNQNNEFYLTGYNPVNKEGVKDTK